MSRGERSRTLGWAYMMSPGSGEWSRPIRCPISCRASTRTSSGANGCPLASKVARVTTPPVRCPSSSHCRSVCPERSPSNWIRHWTRTSAELESASRLNRTGTPASCHRWNALRTASRKAGWKLATVVGGKYTRTGGDTRLSRRRGLWRRAARHPCRRSHEGIPQSGRGEQDREGGDEHQHAAFEHARNMRKHDVAPLALTRWRLYDCGLLMLGT